MAADARRGYVFGPRLQGFFRFSIDLQAGFLVVNSIVDDGGNRSVQIGQEMSTATCIRYVREALGDPDIGVEIESIQRWSASAEYAERLRDDWGAPTGRPGFRAPHLSVKADGAEESTLDLFGRSFVLLAGPQGDSWCTAARTAADAFGVPMRTYRLGAELTDRSGQFETAYGTGQAGAVLVRPDGFVAWRASAPYDDPERTMGEALGRALARTGVA